MATVIKNVELLTDNIVRIVADVDDVARYVAVMEGNGNCWTLEYNEGLTSVLNDDWLDRELPRPDDEIIVEEGLRCLF